MDIKTKFICTIGPATANQAMLESMYRSGMNIIRLNMSHGSHAFHQEIIQIVRNINKTLAVPIPILLDTQGPEIRTGNLENDLQLKAGDVISITVCAEDVEESSIHIDYERLIDTLNIGDRVTVDNGLINLEVLSKEHNRIMTCKVIDGGTLKSKRHVNLPGIRVDLPAITKKDKEDILFGIEQGVDFIALSFVRSADDIIQLRDIVGSKIETIKVIAKIENQEGVHHLTEIIKEADAIMVARGDLGVEIDLEDLPNIQRKIVKKCHEYGKRVIVATHLLESMIENPIPTRAEVTDVANAVYEEVDAIMLSGETTIGKYPLKCIEYLRKISQKSEHVRGLGFSKFLIQDSEKQKLAAAAVELAESLNAAGIVVITKRGVMARLVTNSRPTHTFIYAFTDHFNTQQHMVLNRALTPYLIKFQPDPEDTLLTAFEILKNIEKIPKGSKVVVVSDVLANSSGVDAIHVREIV